MTSANSSERVRATVAVTHARDYEYTTVLEAVRRQFSLLETAGKLISRGDTVLLKPNFLIPRPRAVATQTDPAVILAVGQVVRDMGGVPIVADSPAWGGIRACLRALEMEDQLRALDICVRQMDGSKKYELPGCNGFKIAIGNVVFEADKVINLPKLKTHQQLGGTFAVKNMFGCVPGKTKAYQHFALGKDYDAFCRMLIGIYRLVNPALSIIDGIIAMEGTGPINGRPRRLGVLIGGVDPIACELLCCRLVNFDPRQLPIIRTAHDIGFGCGDLEDCNIVGDDYEELICADFAAAEQTPLGFTLPRVCKSVAKQLFTRLRSAFNRHGRGKD